MSPLQHKLRGIRDSLPGGYVLGRASQGNGPPELIRLSDLARNPAVAGPLAQIAADQLTVASLNVLANDTAASGPASGITLSALLDFATGVVGTPAARGTILYRGASGWALLAPGTAGQYLQTGGAGADPSWLTPPTPNAGTMPLTSGDAGPGIMDDHQGQTIAVPLGATAPYRGTSLKNYIFVTTSGALPASPNLPPGASAIAYCTDISRCRIWDPVHLIWQAALG